MTRTKTAYGFNTQPPEGGWCVQRVCRDFIAVFQHTAARRRLAFVFGVNHGKR